MFSFPSQMNRTAASDAFGTRRERQGGSQIRSEDGLWIKIKVPASPHSPGC